MSTTFGSEGNRSRWPIYRDIFSNESLCETIPALPIQRGKPTKAILRNGSSREEVRGECTSQKRNAQAHKICFGPSEWCLQDPVTYRNSDSLLIGSPVILQFNSGPHRALYTAQLQRRKHLARFPPRRLPLGVAFVRHQAASRNRLRLPDTVNAQYPRHVCFP